MAIAESSTSSRERPAASGSRDGVGASMPAPAGRYGLIALLTLVAVVVMAIEAGSVQPDTWLALVGGREIVEHGLPHHALTGLPAGRTWVDQEWLSQLIMYGVLRLGGLGLLVLVNGLVLLAALLGAVLASLRLGVRPRTLLWLLVPVLWCLQPAATARPQAFAYPLFVAVVYLLVRDVATPSRRVFWCVPLLVLWANLHGSVILGAGLVVLRGLLEILERRRELRAGLRAWARPAALVLAPIACLFATPYGAGMLSYYRAILFNPKFREVLTEWLPVTDYPRIAVGFFALAGIALWSFGRDSHATSRFERVSLLVLLAGSILAVRNVTWFGLLALIVVSRSLDGRLGLRVPRTPRWPAARRRLYIVFTGTCVALACLFAVRLATLSEDALVGDRYPASALPHVETALQERPGLKVLSDSTYADWLLWKLPVQTIHRVAYDAGFELLSDAQLQAVSDFTGQSGLTWPRLADGYGLLALSDTHHHAFARYFGHQPGARILYEAHGLVVIARG